MNNSIINEVCNATKFKYDDNYFKSDIFYNCGTLSVNFQIKSKINDISEDGIVSATIFVDGFDNNRLKYFKNLNDYISYLNEKEMALDFKIVNDLDDFINDIFSDDIIPLFVGNNII